MADDAADDDDDDDDSLWSNIFSVKVLNNQGLYTIYIYHTLWHVYICVLIRDIWLKLTKFSFKNNNYNYVTLHHCQRLLLISLETTSGQFVFFICIEPDLTRN